METTQHHQLMPHVFAVNDVPPAMQVSIESSIEREISERVKLNVGGPVSVAENICSRLR